MLLMVLGECTVRIFEETHYLETVFPDGSKVPAAPQESDAYRETARVHGYGDDTWRLCREHELAHTVLLQKLGFRYSPTLWAVAHGHHDSIPESPGEMEAEETMVLAYQRWQNVRRAV